MAPFRKSAACLCVSTALTAVLMGLLNGEHYAAQLETAWPVARPLTECLSWLSFRSGLPHVHNLAREQVEQCCAALWHADDEEPVEPSPDTVAVEEPPVQVEEPAEPTYEFLGFHEHWLGGEDVQINEFRTFHSQWLGKSEEPPFGFQTYHNQWLGLEAAAKLVDSCPVTCRVLLMGDSLMEDFGVFFYRHLHARRGLQMILLAKFSTGLCRPDYFNWFEVFPRNMEEKKPHVVIFMLGGNDCQPIWYARGKTVPTRPVDRWKLAYGERMGQLLADVEKQQALPLWVGMPVMGGKHASLLARTETAMREECARRNVPYLDNRVLLADKNGNYQSFMKNKAGKLLRIRAKDQQHMTPDGNRMLVQAAMPDFEKLLRQHRLNHPELCVYPGQQNSLAKPSLDVVIPYKPVRK